MRLKSIQGIGHRFICFTLTFILSSKGEKNLISYAPCPMPFDVWRLHFEAIRSKIRPESEADFAFIEVLEFVLIACSAKVL